MSRDISDYGSGTDLGNPKCPQCNRNAQVYRETSTDGRVKSHWVPLISKKVKLDGWACRNCNFYWDK